jgi:hypothetical protein
VLHFCAAEPFKCSALGNSLQCAVIDRTCFMMVAHAYFNIDVYHVFDKLVRCLTLRTSMGTLKIRAYCEPLNVHKILHASNRIAVSCYRNIKIMLQCCNIIFFAEFGPEKLGNCHNFRYYNDLPFYLYRLPFTTAKPSRCCCRYCNRGNYAHRLKWHSLYPSRSHTCSQ